MVIVYYHTGVPDHTATQNMSLPDPLDPNSLYDVIHAAQCVRQAGIIIEGFQSWRDFDYMSPYCQGQNTDTAYAAMVRAAGTVIQPFEHWFCQRALLKYPQTATALIEWASPRLRNIWFTSEVTEPWFWQALLCCRQLNEIQYCINLEKSVGIDHCKDTIGSLVQWVSEQLMPVTRKSFNLNSMPVHLMSCKKQAKHCARRYNSSYQAPYACSNAAGILTEVWWWGWGYAARSRNAQIVIDTCFAKWFHENS